MAVALQGHGDAGWEERRCFPLYSEFPPGNPSLAASDGQSSLRWAPIKVSVTIPGSGTGPWTILLQRKQQLL